jgi:hypothetical protein
MPGNLRSLGSGEAPRRTRGTVVAGARVDEGLRLRCAVPASSGSVGHPAGAQKRRAGLPSPPGSPLAKMSMCPDSSPDLADIQHMRSCRPPHRSDYVRDYVFIRPSGGRSGPVTPAGSQVMRRPGRDCGSSARRSKRQGRGWKKPPGSTAVAPRHLHIVVISPALSGVSRVLPLLQGSLAGPGDR